MNVSIGCKAHTDILTHTQKLIDHAHIFNDKLNGFTIRFKLDTTVSVMTVVLSDC